MTLTDYRRKNQGERLRIHHDPRGRIRLYLAKDHKPCHVRGDGSSRNTWSE